MPQSQAHTLVVINPARGLMVQVQGSESFLGPPTSYHSSREGSSIILPDLVLGWSWGRSEGDQWVTFPGTSLVPTPLNYIHVLDEPLTFPPTPTPVPCLTFPPGSGRSREHWQTQERGDAQQLAGDPAVTMARRQGQEFSC